LILLVSFFVAPLLSVNNEFKKGLEENINSFMELMHSSWCDVMNMPYDSFISSLKWKAQLEEEKRKKFDEKRGKVKDSNSSNGRVSGVF